MGFIPAEVFNYPHGSVIFAVLTYATDVQFMAHAAIAINRFLVLKDSWSDRHQRIAIIVILLVPLPSASIRLACGLKLVETGAGGYALVRDARWVSTAVAITIAVSSFTTSIVSLVFELSSLVVYKRLTLAARAKYRNDFLLLVYAMLQFVVQLALCVTFAISSYGSLIGDPNMASTGATAGKYITIVLSLSPPICVFSTSKLLRRAYADVYCSRWGEGPPRTSSPVAHMRALTTRRT